MRKTLAISLCCFVFSFSRGQSLSASVVGTAGEQFATTSGSLEWTLGEIMTETYQQSNGFFTQGFQQPATIKVTSLEEEEEKNLFVYPNPASDFINVKTTEAGDYLMELFDMQGQKVVNKNSTVGSGNHIHQIDLQGFGGAVYVLRISNITTGKTKRHKIEKL